MFESLRNILSLALVVLFTMGSTDVKEFFPNINGNLTKITWAHAVNNLSYLLSTLENENIMMIEADVVLGLLDGMGEIIPIMGHPPANSSDLSLETFFLRVNMFNNNATDGKKKGVKLDFKTIDVFLASRDIVQRNDKGKYPIWINADIIPGPIKAINTPVDADKFLTGAKLFPNSTLSIGWTTLYGSNYSGSYEPDQIQTMIDTITKNNVTQDVTFPVRAGLAAESIDLFADLIEKVENSSLTIWSSEGDNVDVDHLRQLIAKVGISKAYVDVPSDLLNQLHLNNLPNSSNKFSISILGIMTSVFLCCVSYFKI